MMYSKSVLNPPKTYSVTDIPISTADGFKYFNSLNNTFYDKTFTLTNAWKLRKISEIKNPEFESEFNDKRIEFKSLYNNVEMWETRLGFLTTIKDQMIEKVADIGLEIKLCPYNFLGHNISGVHVSQNADICLLEASEKVHTGEEVILIVFKFMTGKTKYVPACDQSVLLAPTPKFDSHVCDERPDPKQVFTSQYIKSLIYLYEFCSSNFDPITRPRHCCPVFALTFLKIGEIKSPPSFGMSAYPTTYGFESSMPVLKSFDLPRQSTYGGYSSSNSVVASAILPSQTNNSASLLIHKTDRNDDRKVTMSRDPWKNLPNTMHPDSDWKSPPPTDYTKPYSSSYLLSSESRSSNKYSSIREIALDTGMIQYNQSGIEYVYASRGYLRHILSFPDREPFLFFPMTFIPNKLKGHSVQFRSFSIHRYAQSTNSLLLSNLVSNLSNCVIVLYVPKGSVTITVSQEPVSVILFLNKGQALRIYPTLYPSSTFFLIVTQPCTVFAIEEELIADEYLNSVPNMESYIFDDFLMPPTTIISEQHSFSRVKPCPSASLLFIGASYAKSKKTSHLIKVSIVNRHSEEIFTCQVTPRERYENCNTSVHGITAEQMLGHLDNVTGLKPLHDAICGRTLVGFDLQQLLSLIHMSPNMVMGLRDLSYTPLPDKPKYCPYPFIMSLHPTYATAAFRVYTAQRQAVHALQLFAYYDRPWQDAWSPPEPLGLPQDLLNVADCLQKLRLDLASCTRHIHLSNQTQTTPVQKNSPDSCIQVSSPSSSIQPPQYVENSAATVDSAFSSPNE